MSEQCTLVQVDIVDSTALGEKLGDDAMSSLWAEHDRAARDLLVQWKGQEIDKSDGFLLLFETPDAALTYLLDYRRSIARLRVPLQARCGMHVGRVRIRPNPEADVARGAKPLELDGGAKPLTARVMALARAGQILLTRDAKETLRGHAVVMRGRGHWRMKGFAEPVEIFEVLESDDNHSLGPPVDTEKAYKVFLRGDSWIPVREIKHTVPAERDRFIGREELLNAVQRRIDEGARLVSIVGTGGVGKTRLATHFAARCLGDFGGGTWFCDLSQARTLDGVVSAVARGLDISLGKTDPVEQLSHSLASRGPSLVLLDNLEQVVQICRRPLGHWLDHAPDARFIVTSREVLGIQGEHVIAIEPLPHGDAVALFRERDGTARARPHSTEDRLAIERLADVLDGLPLAIELAAARLRVMAPRTLLARIGQRFQLLASREDPEGRQSTLKGAFDWSWDLLSPPEKASLAQTSVFVGGFSLEAAEAVVELGLFPRAPTVLDVVHSLVDKSFIRVGEEGRLSLLESIRQYADEQFLTGLSDVGLGGESRADAENRHGSFFGSLPLNEPGGIDAQELENIAAACDRALLRLDVDTATRTCEKAWEIICYRGPYRRGVDCILRVMAMPGQTVTALMKLESMLGRALLMSGKSAQARAPLVSSLARAGGNSDQQIELGALSSLAELNLGEGHMAEAYGQYTAALAKARELGNLKLQCSVLNGIGLYFTHLGRLGDAQATYADALAVATRANDLRWQAGSLSNLGQVLANQGENQRAHQCYEDAVKLIRAVGDRLWEGTLARLKTACAAIRLSNRLSGRLVRPTLSRHPCWRRHRASPFSGLSSQKT